jgi:hypothetical protein
MDYYRHDLMYRSGAIVIIIFVDCAVGCAVVCVVDCAGAGLVLIYQHKR